jgi:transposase
MSKARLVITAVVIEGRKQAEVARSYGVSQSWVSKLVARYRIEGDAAFEPKSRRPKTSPTAISDQSADLIVRLRKELTGQGLDAGPDTIKWHLAQHHDVLVSAATWPKPASSPQNRRSAPRPPPSASKPRCRTRPGNRIFPKHFLQGAAPTHYRLITGADVEILTWLDDCTRHAIASPPTSASPSPSSWQSSGPRSKTLESQHQH